MRVLLDTNAFLWLATDPGRLGDALPMLEDPATVRLVSAVVGWELAIKHGLGRIELPQPPDVWVPRVISDGVMTPLAVELEHSLGVARLAPVHRDPFDRLLVAQAKHLDVPVVTADHMFVDYGVEVIRP